MSVFRNLSLTAFAKACESKLLGAWLPSCVPVFMLHRVHGRDDAQIGGISKDYLRQCLSYLRSRKYRVLSMDELRACVLGTAEIPERAVAFTIDDGFYDHYEHASHVFGEFDYPLNLFLVTGFISGVLWPWDDQVDFALRCTKLQQVKLSFMPNLVEKEDAGPELVCQLSADRSVQIEALQNQLKVKDQSRIYDWIKNHLYVAAEADFPGEAPADYRPLTWSEASRLSALGHGVYAHTRSHRILSQLGDQDVDAEIRGSIDDLVQQGMNDQSVFAYPTGRFTDYDARAKALLKQCGVTMAFSAVPGYAAKQELTLELPRFSMPGHFPDFLQYLTKFEALKNRIRAHLQ